MCSGLGNRPLNPGQRPHILIYPTKKSLEYRLNRVQFNTLMSWIGRFSSPETSNRG